MIKILFLVNDLGLGGVQRLVVDFANSLDKEKFSVQVATLYSRKESFFNRDLLKKEIGFTNFSFSGFWDFREWRKFYRFLKQNRFDVVFTQLFMADTIGRTAAFFAGVPLIATEIQNIIPTLPKKFVVTNKILGKITDLCVSPTAAVTAYAKSVAGFSAEKIVEVPTNAVDAKRFDVVVDRRRFRRNFGWPEDVKIIINIGRLVEQKGQSVLLSAAPKILEKEPKARFLIVGSGYLEEKLKSQSAALGLNEFVKFLGERKDTPELLLNSDIFAFPSLWEGQGLILFEAIFAKIPIVASDTGGIPDVITDGVAGVLAPAGDSDGLAIDILKVLNDSALAQKLTAEAFKRFGDRTLDNSARKLEAALEKALRAKSGPRRLFSRRP